MSRLATVNIHDLPLTTGRRPTPAFLANVKLLGVTTPIVIGEAGDGYLIIDGNRRVAALRALGHIHASIDAKILDQEEVHTLHKLLGTTATARHLPDITTLALNWNRSENYATQTDALMRLFAAGLDKSTITTVTGSRLTVSGTGCEVTPAE